MIQLVLKIFFRITISVIYVFMRKKIFIANFHLLKFFRNFSQNYVNKIKLSDLAENCIAGTTFAENYYSNFFWPKLVTKFRYRPTKAKKSPFLAFLGLFLDVDRNVLKIF